MRETRSDQDGTSSSRDDGGAPRRRRRGGRAPRGAGPEFARVRVAHTEWGAGPEENRAMNLSRYSRAAALCTGLAAGAVGAETPKAVRGRVDRLPLRNATEKATQQTPSYSVEVPY